MEDKILQIDTVVYAGRAKDKNVLLNSSSGGAFTVISDIFLQYGNAIVCSIYDYKSYTTRFMLITDKRKRDSARGSKYMQSKPCNIYKESSEWLLRNPTKKLLFIGVGCQADGFRRFAELKGFRSRVYIVDLICHGSPSPKLWREYADSIEWKADGKITYLTFKDKRNGWNHPTAVAVINNKEVLIKDYVRVFYNSCALRPSCHVCPYATTERKTDITIGDFWHIEKTIPDFYDPDGTSLFLLHTNRGEELFNNIKGNLDYRLSNTEQCWQANLEAPTPMSEHRQVFWMDYQRKGIDYVMKKYGSASLKNKIRNKFLQMMNNKHVK